MPTCFVIMGFGEKTDLATGRKLDLDKSYKNMIKPAITDAGYVCVRADEIQHAGVIDVPMYDMLFTADLVVADISTANVNAIFELGVRHALKPRSTIIIAEEQYKYPFDLNHIVIRPYIHLGPDIGFDETMRMRGDLKNLAEALKTSQAVDSPVYTMMPDLAQPTRNPLPGIAAAVPPQPKGADHETYAALFEFALKAKNDGDFDLAKKILQQVCDEQTKPGADGRPKPAQRRVTHELALATYKSGEKAARTAGPGVALDAYAAAAALLLPLDPETTTDPETLGLWSAIHKRRAEVPTRSEDERKADLDIAIRAAERSFIIRGDYYTGTNLAYLLNVRAAASTGDDQIADRVLANRVRSKVVEISTERLKTLEKSLSPDPGAPTALEEEKYWTAASLAESLIALGQNSGTEILQKAVASAPAAWMAEVSLSQLGKLQRLLADTPQKGVGGIGG